MAQSTGQQLIQQNAQMRAALLATSPRMRKNLGTFTGGDAGGTTRVKLYNVGIITRLVLRVSVPLDIATGVQAAGKQAPFNLINRVRLTDFDGTDRVNCTGYELFMINCKRRKSLFGYNNNGATAVIHNPVVPTASITDGTQSLQFYMEIPLAYDPQSDLRGAILAQTALGEMYLNIDWNNLLWQSANDDAVYTAATNAVTQHAAGNISVQVWQEFLLPQSIGGQVPLPQLDLLTVYELAGALKSSDNIAANTEKLINFPNVRSVIGATVRYIENGVMRNGRTLTSAGIAETVENNISQIRIIANGNNILYDNTGEGHLFDQRLMMDDGGDIRPGSYMFDFGYKPIETALYGNVQLGITPKSATATTYAPYMGICFESFYTKGATLPGMSQSGS